MGKVISVNSEKGGVGKTTVALNLALALSELEHEVLLVDLDPQGSIGHSLCKSDTQLAGLVEVLMQSMPLSQALLETKSPFLTLLPRGRLDPLDVVDFELSLHTPGVLVDIVSAVRSRFDYVLFDTPSGLGAVARGALVAADYVLLPVQAEPLALRGLGRLLRLVERVRTAENPRLKLAGLLATMVDRKQDASHSVMMELWAGFDGLLETSIPRAPVFAEASLRGVPVAYLAGPRSPEARRFELLAKELLSVLEELEPVREESAHHVERTLL